MRQWRLNTSFLNNKEFSDFIKSELNTYLDLNAAPEQSPLILWNCAKAYIKGCTIYVASIMRKKSEARLSEIENKIRYLEEQHKPAPTFLTSPVGFKLRIKNMIVSSPEKWRRIQDSPSKYYENGNGASKLLAMRLKKQQPLNMIQATIAEPDNIAEYFAKYYKSLYKNTNMHRR